MKRRITLLGFLVMLFCSICLVKEVKAADMGTIEAEYTILDAKGNTKTIEKSFAAEMKNDKEYIYNLCVQNAPNAENNNPVRAGWYANISENYQEDDSDPTFWYHGTCKVYMKEKI